MSRLVVVSNRVAPAEAGKVQAGGLAVGLYAALKEREGLWFGWSGDVVAAPPDDPYVFTARGVTFATLDLAQRDYDEYYNGFSNSALWPLLHFRLDLAVFSREDYEAYQRVNTRFARMLAPLLRESDTIWVHDYHLISLGEALRKLGFRQKIGFFLHTPFPSYRLLVALPQHRELMRALCAYDLVGFQTERDMRSFANYIEYEAGGRVEKARDVRAFRRRTRIGTFPIGIDTADVARLARESVRSRQVERMRHSLGGRSLIIGVDRLDYSKGMPERFNAYEKMLSKYPDHRNRVVLMQIAPPSREDVAEYLEIRQSLEAMTGHINGRYAEFDWVPLRYLNKSFSRRELAGFYRIARVGLVTPLRDGMNLVAKEYVAAQDPRNPGVLVLSRFAGSARELSSAVIVNPYDEDGMADALDRALAMPLAERRRRWRAAMTVIEKNDITAWRSRFLNVLARTPRTR